MINARALQDKVLLRWAVDTPLEWKRANTTGFKLTKFIIKRDGKVLLQPEKTELSSKLITPEPLESWMDLIQKDNYAAIIAQGIYGESFEVGDTKEGQISKIINIAEELDQRYSFSLYAADMSFEGALKAGWGFVDKNVKANEEYVYQIAIAENLLVKPSSYAISLKDFVPLPAPTDLFCITDEFLKILKNNSFFFNWK
ncbi:MAG: hypothetical protein HC854_11275 [Flavobacterium sp.]|nr:hypothetical protein [Flavobacterium sp.]